MNSIQLITKHNKYNQIFSKLELASKGIYCLGNTDILDKTLIGIVGTRQPTNYGINQTRILVNKLSRLDVGIVSGLAIGIDIIAHKASIRNNLPTIAVLPNSLEQIYPKRHTAIAQEIGNKGLLVSEYIGSSNPTLPYHFPKRNRIISGLSDILIVVEADINSGSLITANQSLLLGKKVLALPGNIDSKFSRGTNALIGSGAAIQYTEFKDILKIIDEQINYSSESIDLLSPTEYDIFDLIALGYTTLEQLKKQSSLHIKHIESILSILEIKGKIISKNNSYWIS